MHPQCFLKEAPAFSLTFKAHHNLTQCVPQSSVSDCPDEWKVHVFLLSAEPITFPFAGIVFHYQLYLNLSASKDLRLHSRSPPPASQFLLPQSAAVSLPPRLSVTLFSAFRVVHHGTVSVCLGYQNKVL